MVQDNRFWEFGLTAAANVLNETICAHSKMQMPQLEKIRREMASECQFQELPYLYMTFAVGQASGYSQILEEFLCLSPCFNQIVRESQSLCEVRGNNEQGNEDKERSRGSSWREES